MRAVSASISLSSARASRATAVFSRRFSVAILAHARHADVALDAAQQDLQIVTGVGLLDERTSLLAAHGEQLLHTGGLRRVAPCLLCALELDIDSREVEQGSLVRRRCFHVGPAGIEPTTTWV